MTDLKVTNYAHLCRTAFLRPNDRYNPLTLPSERQQLSSPYLRQHGLNCGWLWVYWTIWMSNQRELKVKAPNPTLLSDKVIFFVNQWIWVEASSNWIIHTMISKSFRSILAWHPRACSQGKQKPLVGLFKPFTWLDDGYTDYWLN